MHLNKKHVTFKHQQSPEQSPALKSWFFACLGHFGRVIVGWYWYGSALGIVMWLLSVTGAHMDIRIYVYIQMTFRFTTSPATRLPRSGTKSASFWLTTPVGAKLLGDLMSTHCKRPKLFLCSWASLGLPATMPLAPTWFPPPAYWPLAFRGCARIRFHCPRSSGRAAFGRHGATQTRNKTGGDREGRNSNSRQNTSAETSNRLGATTDTCSTLSLCQEPVKTSSRETPYA